MLPSIINDMGGARVDEQVKLGSSAHPITEIIVVARQCLIKATFIKLFS